MGVSCCNDGPIVDLRQTLPLESIYDKWSGRADLAGKCSRREHNQKDTSSPEAIRPIRMASRPVRPASSPTRKRDNKLLVIPRNVTTLSAACLHAAVLAFVCLRAHTLRGELGCLTSADVSARRRAKSRSLFVATAPSCSQGDERIRHKFL